MAAASSSNSAASANLAAQVRGRQEHRFAVIQPVAGQSLHDAPPPLPDHDSVSNASVSAPLTHANAIASPTINSAGPATASAASDSPPSVVDIRRSSGRLAFSTISAGVAPDLPAAIRRAAI